MTQFPHALTLPADVHTFRLLRGKKVIRAVCLGIYFRMAVISFELVGVFWTSSSALLLDALSSVMDVLASIFLIFSIKLAQRPPDNNHPFGHGRYEPMGGLLLSLFLVVLGSLLFFQQIFKIFGEAEHKEILSWAWVFSAIAMGILEIAYRIIIRAAKKSQSPSILADAYHYRIDSLTSLFATGALLSAALWPQWSILIDHCGAIIIAIFLGSLGLLAARDNFHQLMDKRPEPHFFEIVKEAALKAPGVEATEKIRIQRYGPDAHVDIDVEVNPQLPVDMAHRISQEVRLEIQKAWPAVRDVTVHIEPYYANDH